MRTIRSLINRLLMQLNAQTGDISRLLGWPTTEWTDAPEPAAPLDADWLKLDAQALHTFTHFRPMRAVFEVLGVQDVVSKSIGSSNPHNMIKATFSALTNMQAPRSVAQKRGKRVGDILGKRSSDDATAAS